MRPATSIMPADADEAFVHQFDLREIDANNPYSFWRLKYLERIHAVVRTVRHRCAPGARTLEIGAAQGNISLLLAEAGYDATAVDLREGFLSYSRRKYQRGTMRWLCGDAFDLSLGEEFDAVILAEILEHVAHPRDLIARCLALATSGGILIITTPNHHFLRERSLAYGEAAKDTGRMEAEQFGPAGENHLFTLTMAELSSMVPPDGVAVDKAFLDSILYNNHLQGLWNHKRARALLLPLTHRLRMVPVAREFANAGLIMAIQRN